MATSKPCNTCLLPDTYLFPYQPSFFFSSLHTFSPHFPTSIFSSLLPKIYPQKLTGRFRSLQSSLPGSQFIAMAPSSTLAAHTGMNRFNTPSPNPTHLSIGVHNQRVLTDDASGYVAPVFEGKEKQMELGKFYPFFSHHLTVLSGEGRGGFNC